MSIPQEEAERRVDDTARRFFSPARRFQRNGLTGVRALAACLVMGFHLNAMVGPKRMYLGFESARVEVTHLLTIGWVGVNVFFVLSGFLLAIHLFERMQEGSRSSVLVPYLRGRVLRVVPAYWAKIALVLVIAWIALGEHPPWTRYIPAHLFFVHNGSFRAHGKIDAVFWTLPVEFTFYLLLPFAMTWVMGARSSPPRPHVGRALAFAAGAVVLAIAWRAAAFAAYGDWDLGKLFWMSTAQWPGLFDQFAMGMAAATIYLALGSPHAAADPRWGRRGDALAVAGLSGLVGLMYLMHVLFDRYWTGSPTFYLWNPAVAVCVAVLVFGVAIHGPLVRAVFANAAVVFVGTVSYSMYLWHGEIGDFLANRFGAPQLGFWRFFAIAVPTILAASAVSYFLVERPFLRMKERSPGVGAAPALEPAQRS